VSGCSFGGIETVLTAARSTSIYAAVDFAGASMSWASSPVLQDRMRAAVRESHVPILFLQAKNDFNTAPSRDLAAEMTSAGKPHALAIFPPHGETHQQGHAGFCMHGEGEWGETVLAFLRDPSAPVPKP
jgi:dienelactone hydrolase